MADATRITMVTADEWIDRRILLQVESLLGAGFDVRLVATGGPHETAGAAGAPASKPPSSVPKNPWPRRAIVGAFDRLNRFHPPSAAWLNAVAKRTLVKPFYRTRRELERGLRELGGDIIVAHDLPVLPVAHDASRRLGARLVYDSHELYTEQEVPLAIRQTWRRTEAALVGDCDLVITVNRSIADELERRYRLAGVQVILNAARRRTSPPTGRLRASLGLEQGVRIALFQGNMTTHRNLETLVRAGAELEPGRAVIVFLGDGPELPSLEALARSLGVSVQVRFHPRVDQKNLLDFTADADIGLVPYRATSLNTELCTPNKLFEYIASRVPVLSSDLAELRRIVVGHGIGQVGSMEDPRAVGQWIATTLRDDDRLAAWRAALATAAAALDWSVEESKLVAMYRRLEGPIFGSKTQLG